METRYLNTLVVSVEAGTFSKASEILHITQSAVSQRIKFLEDHFGQQLLDRSGQRLALTTAGKVVFSKAKDILDKERELLSCLQTSNSRKRLSICCTPTFGMAYLPQVLNDFLRVHSDMNDLKFIFMQPEEALAGLRHEEFDLAVIEHRLDLDFNGFDRYSMPDDEMLVVAASSMALPSVDGTVELEDLKGMRLFARRDGCIALMTLRALSFQMIYASLFSLFSQETGLPTCHRPWSVTTWLPESFSACVCKASSTLAAEALPSFRSVVKRAC
jgi:DNA-binding transcriptional LysR family regulator